jgi:hypothetical protein
LIIVGKNGLLLKVGVQTLTNGVEEEVIDWIDI